MQVSFEITDEREDETQTENIVELKKTPMLFRFVGGKYYALKKLKPFWDIPHDEYREPMVGGGSVFLAKSKATHNWLNDIDTSLITAYSVIADPIKRKILIARLRAETASKKRHGEIKKYNPHSDIDIAYKYYYLNRTSFSGKMKSPVWGYKEKRSLPPARWHERISPCGKKLEMVKMTNEDFEGVIRARGNGKVLMFIDPPYFVGKNNGHYTHRFEYDDHVRLSNVLRQTKHCFFLTYDDSSEVRKMYEWVNIFDLNFIYHVDNSQANFGARKNGSEIVITNYQKK